MKPSPERRPPSHPTISPAADGPRDASAPSTFARCATALLSVLLGLGLATLVMAVGTQSAGLVQVRPFGSGGEGSYPQGELVQATDGNFYGTTSAGGHGYGTVYSVTAAGTFTTLYNFSSSDGSSPRGKLIQGTDGNLYGTTYSGGANGTGTVFRITTAGVFTSLHSFTGTEGSNPEAGLVQGTDGNFYGTTYGGGTGNTGSLFKITSAGTLTVLHSFGTLNSQNTNSDGAYSSAALVQGSDGNFYGTAYAGGINGVGTIFRMTPAGVVTDLHDFTSSEGDRPEAGLVIGTDGNFYGTTYTAGSLGYGTIFQFTPSRVLTVLHTFNGYANNGGGYSSAALFQATDGNFYGTTGIGSYTSSQSTLFQITSGGVYTTIATLVPTSYNFNTIPQTGVIQGTDGKLYGSTGNGGANSLGAVYSVTTSGTYTALHSFVGPASEGTSPQATLLQGSDGAFYGTTSASGQGGHGTVFRFAADGTFGLLHSFTGTDGNDSTAGLIQDASGNFYGTTYSGGANGNGVVFQITPAGAYNVLHNFGAFNSGSSANSDGANPRGGVILGTDNNLYGTTYSGGSLGYGVVFRLALDGTFTVLYSFTDTDGQRPYAGVIQGTDGNLYGTTYTGGSLGYGTVFEITLSGMPTTLYNFSGGVDGSNPEAGLVQAADGNFYGTTYSGGANGTGTVFQVMPTGTLTVLHSFAAPTYSGSPYNPDGSNPTAALTLGSGGILYGTTYSGGSQGYGTVFSITTGGVLTTLFNFNYTYGFAPLGGVIQGPNGHFYGTTTANGAIYELELIPVITSPATASATAGQPFSYQITAINTPTSYNAFNLPAGLVVDTGTGVISGTISQAGTYTITLSSTNTGGTGTAPLTLTVSGPPVITGSLIAYPEVGTPFFYQINATNSPTSYAATNLPTGLSVDTGTGAISGTPGIDGQFAVGLSASNAVGTGTATLTLFIDPAQTPTPTPTPTTPTPTPTTPTPTPTTPTPTPPTTTPTPTPTTPTPTPSTPTPAPAQPTVTLTSPLDGQAVVAGANLPLAVSVVDPDAILAQVQFFIDGNAVGTVSATPFVFNASAPSSTGSHSVQAVATDRLGRTSTSSATLNVTAALPTVPPPTSSVVTPLANRNLVAGSAVAISVSADVDASTSLDHVSLYANGALVTTFVPGDGSTQAAPAGQPTRQAATRAASIVFQTTYTLPGTDEVVNLVAVALDKLGQSSISRIASIHSTVTTDRPPRVALTGVNNSAHVKVGSVNAVTVTATAASTSAVAGRGKVSQDTAGTLTLLEYYLNGTKLGEASAPPFSFNFTPPAAGKYVLHAVATDAAGLSSITDPVTVQADVPVVPTVNLAVGGTGAAVEGGANGVIVVTRTGGDNTAALTVFYKAKGAAKPGTDYKALSGTLTIPAGAPKAKLKIKPINGSPNAGTLKIKLVLTPPTDGSYVVGTGNVKIKLIGR